MVKYSHVYPMIETKVLFCTKILKAKQDSLRLIRSIEIVDIKNHDFTLFVLDYYKIPIDKVFSSSRKREYCYPRFILMNYFKCNYKFSLKLLSSQFNNRHHSTIIHGLRTFDDLLEFDKTFFKEYFTLTTKYKIEYELRRMEREVQPDTEQVNDTGTD